MSHIHYDFVKGVLTISPGKLHLAAGYEMHVGNTEKPVSANHQISRAALPADQEVHAAALITYMHSLNKTKLETVGPLDPNEPTGEQGEAIIFNN